MLAYLEQELVAAHYDLKHIYRLILNSQTYQLSLFPGATIPRATANFAYYPLRRLEAEVLIDALCQITGTTEQYSSLIPEPFTFIPEEQRSIALADGSITSPFLEMFGRPSRDTGLESERNNRPTAAQRLHLLNSSHIRRKIEQSPQARRALLQPKRKTARDRRRALPDDPFALPTDGRIEDHRRRLCPAGGNESRRPGAGGPGLGADQQRGVSATGIEDARSG